MRAVIGLAGALVILALAMVPLFTPVWLGPAQDRAGVAALTGYDPSTVGRVSGALVADLLFGPPDFDVTVDGAAVLSPEERGHLRDVRAVLAIFGGLVLAAAAILVVSVGRAGAGQARAAVVTAIGRGGLGLTVVVAGLGIVALVAFEPAFEVFHRLFFSGGNWAFDPARDRLVQLFPTAFWQDTTVALGVLAIALGLAVAGLARRAAGTTR